MRRSTRNWLTSLGLTNLSRRSRRQCRRDAQSGNSQKLAVEQLEDRRMLAVGSFLRLEGIPGADADISSFISATAAANSAYDPATGPNYEDVEDDMLVRSAISRYASDAGATASSFVKAAGFILTPIGGSIAVPFVSIESVQVGAATQGSGGAEAFSSPSAGLRGKFEYQDPTPQVAKEFYGAIYIPAIGVGVASGEQSSWGTSQIPSGSIKKNGVTVASVSVFGSGGSGLGKPGSIEYTVSVWVDGQEPNLPLIVTTTEDVDDGDYSFHDLSLREAIALAADVNHPGQDTIVFAKWVDEIDLGGTQLVVNSDIHIAGPGADKLTIDANDLSRAFTINSGVQATISGMTITGGHLTGVNHGGAIYNNGDLTINAVVATGNDSAVYGGAVYTHGLGKLRIVDSTFTLNSAGATGGAIFSNSNQTGALVIERSAFYDNEADSGGAILLDGSDTEVGTATISNSTFSGNRALTGGGGAIKNGSGAPPLTIVNSTIAYNTSYSGGGGIDMHHISEIRFTLHNTILAHNESTLAVTDNLNRAVNPASSYNLIGYGGTSGLTNGVAGNILLGSGVSAGLATLDDYGGKTKTHALLVSSPALDLGNDSLATAYDQRGAGYDRIIDGDGVGGARIDIGAYEYDPAASLALAVSSSQTSRESYFESLDSDLRMQTAMAALFQAEQEATAGRSFWPGHRRMRSRS